MTTKKPRPDRPVERNPRWIAFGRRLIDLRKAKGWKAYEVAGLIDIDPASYSNLENGNRATGPERQTLENLAGLYGMTVDELLGERDSARRHEGRQTRDVFPRSDPGAEPRSAIGAPELADIRAAVSDAIFAAFTDIFEAVAHARSAAHAPREASSPVRREPGERTGNRIAR